MLGAKETTSQHLGIHIGPNYLTYENATKSDESTFVADDLAPASEGQGSAPVRQSVRAGADHGT